MRRISARPLTAKSDSGPNTADPKRVEVALRHRYRQTLEEHRLYKCSVANSETRYLAAARRAIATLPVRDGRYNIDSSTIDILVSKFRYFASIVHRLIFPRIDAQSLNIELRYHFIFLMKKRYIRTLIDYCVASCRVARATCQCAGATMLSTFNLSSKRAQVRTKPSTTPTIVFHLLISLFVMSYIRREFDTEI